MDGLYARYALPQIQESERWQQNRQIFTIYNLYRLVLSLILLISFAYRFVPTSPLGEVDPELFRNLCYFYIGLNVLSLALPLLRMSQQVELLQHSSILVLDILTLALISYTCGGVSSGMAHLLIVPIAAGSILFGIRMSTFYAAIATIAAIYSEVYTYRTTPFTESYYVQAGLLGFTLFATSLSLQYLGGRIRQKDIINRVQAASIRSLQETNQQIIERMQTGIVVVDLEARVLSFNDSARKLLLDPALAHDVVATRLALPPVLLEQLAAWQQDQDVRALPFRVAENGREVQANFTYLEALPQSSILIFLEDHTQLSSRAQHLKLIALGRLTASIAHEVRNPLGAISHASQLLEESPGITGADQRLLNIINTHSKRVNAIIQNILDLSRHRQEVPERIDAIAWLEDFAGRLGNSYHYPIAIDLERIGADPAHIRFNTSQLEQLLTNLCDNGLRYSRQHTGDAKLDIRVGKHPFTGLPMIDVIDNGPGVPAEKQEQIFEPFFTTEKSGTGLGLFICREICEANQAQIFYRRTADERSSFRIIFSHPDRHIN
jgi:two-component system sensor histidine kinase PilS (NtrC family)